MKPGSEEYRRRAGRNVALALTLAGLVVLFFVVTIVKLKSGMS